MKLTSNINKYIFREYDIRGIYEKDLTEDLAADKEYFKCNHR